MKYSLSIKVVNTYKCMSIKTKDQRYSQVDCDTECALKCKMCELLESVILP